MFITILDYNAKSIIKKSIFFSKTDLAYLGLMYFWKVLNFIAKKVELSGFREADGYQ